MRLQRLFTLAATLLAAALPVQAAVPSAFGGAPRDKAAPAPLGQSPFLWGVAMSGYQNDGGTPATDWYAMERSGKVPEQCGRGPDFRGHMDADLDRAASLGLNAFRTSFEWARLEPAEGKFDPAEVAYLHQLLEGIKKRGMTPVIALHHFSMPAWAMRDRGDGLLGWESPRTVAAFGRYVAFVAKEFGSQIDWYITFNEPSSFLLGGYGGGMLPPGRMGPLSLWLASRNVLAAHELAYAQLHAHDDSAMVSLSEYNGLLPLGTGVDYRPGQLLHWLLSKQPAWDGTARVKALDYVALHYYGTNRAFLDFPIKPHLWEGNPAHFAETLRAYYETFRLPILVAENGFAEKNGEPRADGWTRESFLVAHVKEVQSARAAGIPVVGYMYWTLTDNYEWGSFDSRFGLWRVDVRSGDLTRHETPAAGVYRAIVKAGGVSPELARRYAPPGLESGRQANVER